MQQKELEDFLSKKTVKTEDVLIFEKKEMHDSKRHKIKSFSGSHISKIEPNMQPLNIPSSHALVSNKLVKINIFKILYTTVKI